MQSSSRYRILHAKVTFASLAFSGTAFAEEQARSATSTLLSMLIPLVIVLGAMILALVLVRRRFGIVSNDGPMRVKQILAVGPRERMVLVDMGSHTMVVGVTSSRISRIACFGTGTGGEARTFDTDVVDGEVNAAEGRRSP